MQPSSSFVDLSWNIHTISSVAEASINIINYPSANYYLIRLEHCVILLGNHVTCKSLIKICLLKYYLYIQWVFMIQCYCGMFHFFPRLFYFTYHLDSINNSQCSEDNNHSSNLLFCMFLLEPSWITNDCDAHVLYKLAHNNHSSTYNTIN